MEIKEKKCRTIMSESGLYDTDYSINPFTGCSHGCVYCYAPYILREKRNWGTFVDVKINAPEVLAKEMHRKKKKNILISSVTDPYQETEKKYKITRQLLEKLVNTEFIVSILTKSANVLRDIDLFKKLKCEIGITITTLDVEAAKVFEPGASNPEHRLEALRYLKYSGLKTYVFFGPLLPFVSDVDLEKAINRFSLARPDYIIVDRLNVKGRNHWNKVKNVLQIYYPDLVNKWEEILFSENKYYENLKQRLIELFQEYDVKYEFCY